MTSLLKKLARPLELLLALVFAAGVVLKALDINLFAVQIAGYGVLRDTSTLGRAALAMLMLETFLALLLLLGASARTALYTLVGAVLTGFTALIAYGWYFHDLEDCGCFGLLLEMSPGLSIGKNLLLMVITALAWRGFSLRTAETQARRDTPGKIAVAVILSLVLIVGVSTTLEHIEADAPQPYAQFQIMSESGYFDLAEGTYLVALLSMGCDHCMAEVPALNALPYHPDLPPLVALCFEEMEGQIDEFRALTYPEFPMHNLGTKTLLLYSLLGEEAQVPPRLVLVRDGAEVMGWSVTPDPVALAEAVAAALGE